MKKIFLVYDDYNELRQVEADLKKIGFDTMGVCNETRLNDSLLGFYPDLTIVQGNTHLVSSLSVGKKLQESQAYQGKVILIFKEGQRPNPSELASVRMNAILQAPLEREQLVSAIAKVLGLDSTVLLAKYSKVRAQDPHVRPLNKELREDQVKSSSFDDPGRKKRFEAFLNLDIDKTQTSHNRAAIRHRQAELQKGWNFNFLEKIDLLKHQFAKALFKKSN